MVKGNFYGNQHTLDKELEYGYKDLVEDINTLAYSLGRPPTTRDAEMDSRLPSIKKMYRLLDDREWNELLDDAGVGSTQVGEYGREECPKICRDIRRVYEQSAADYLTVREYDRRGNYNKSVLKRLFGTWNAACTAAEVPHGQKHGRLCEGPNGAILDSKLEVEIAQALVREEVAYEPHKVIPATNWSCDFYLLKDAFWIEVDGYIRGQRPNKDSFERKLGHYQRNEMLHAVVSNVSELEEKVFQRI